MSNHAGLHNFEQQVEGALANESAQNGYAQAPSAPSSNHLSPNGPATSSGQASSATTIAGSRDPTIKHTDTASTHSERTAHADPALSERQFSLSEKASKHDDEEAEDTGLLSGFKLYAVFLSLMLSVFSIVATAIPVIVSEFQAFAEVPWVITAYFLTQCGLILLVGQILSITKAKWVLLASIFFFELGSLLCAVANGMIFESRARDWGGWHVCGFVGGSRYDHHTETAAYLYGFGPLLGGVFTERLTWRWCFWINLPLGGVAALAVIFLLPARDPVRHGGQLGGWAGVKQLDYIGAALSLAFVTCLLLALQWGGNNYPWGNWRIILLFILGGLLVVAFFLWQWKLDQRALMPLSLLKNRTQLAAMGTMFMLMMGMLGGTYQLPLFYQAARGRSPEQSGIDIIPFMLAVCIGIFISGGFAQKTGRYWPWLVIGPPFSAVGFGLLYTIDSNTATSRLIGYQILAGVGVGMAFQQSLLAIQVEYSDRPYLIPQANGVVSFFQLTGAALGVGIVNTVQSIFLNRELAARAADVPFDLIRQSPTAIYTALAPELRQGAIDAYTKAITESFIPIIVGIGLAWIFGLFVKNESTRGKVIEGGVAA